MRIMGDIYPPTSITIRRRRIGGSVRNTVWSRRPGLNGRPAVYETAALPTELRRHLGETEGGTESQSGMITATGEPVNKANWAHPNPYGPICIGLGPATDESAGRYGGFCIGSGFGL
jgi:hypothetical protein